MVRGDSLPGSPPGLGDGVSSPRLPTVRPQRPGLLPTRGHQATFQEAQMVKNLPATQETRVRSPGLEDPLEEGMATRSSILAWRSPWTEEPGGLRAMGLQRVRHH